MMVITDICHVEDCGNKRIARGFCTLHYQRWKKWGDPLRVEKPSHKPPSGKKCTVDGCGRLAAGRGLCKKHHKRLMAHGDPLAGRTERGALIKWLEAHKDHQAQECLMWPFWRDESHGYGHVTYDGRGMKPSRVMCILAHGKPPVKGLQSAHSCGNGHLGCVNPRHLRWATRSQNQMDRVEHGTHNRGERQGQSKLRSNDVLSIRSLEGKETSVQVATQFGIHPRHVRSIWSRETWGWLQA